jgi:hypothetical protein
MSLTKLGLALGLVGVSWSFAARAQPSMDTQPPPQQAPPLPANEASDTPSSPPPPAATAPAPAPTTPPAATTPTTPPAAGPSSTPGTPPAAAPPEPAPAPAPAKSAGAEPKVKPPEPPKDVTVNSSTAASQALSTRAANAEIAGNPQAALTYAAKAVAADPNDPWAHYDKAAALARLGNVDDAVKSFAAAEARFNPADIWGRSVAIYGGAHALSEAGRCEEARSEFQRYAAFVRERDPRSADIAMRYSAGCITPARLPASTPTPGPVP